VIRGGVFKGVNRSTGEQVRVEKGNGAKRRGRREKKVGRTVLEFPFRKGGDGERGGRPKGGGHVRKKRGKGAPKRTTRFKKGKKLVRVWLFKVVPHSEGESTGKGGVLPLDRGGDNHRILEGGNREEIAGVGMPSMKGKERLMKGSI